MYVAAAGAVALGIASAFGASASGIQGRAVDANQDGILDITRAEAMSAQRNATTANVLFAAGGAAAIGGGAWLVFSGKF